MLLAAVPASFSRRSRAALVAAACHQGSVSSVYVTFGLVSLSFEKEIQSETVEETDDQVVDVVAMSCLSSRCKDDKLSLGTRIVGNVHRT